MVDHESAIIVPSPNMSTGRMSRRSSPGAKRSARDEEVDLLTPLLQRSNSRDKGRFASDPTTTAPALSLRGSPNTTRAAKSTQHHRRKRSQIAPTTIRDVGLFGNLYLNVAMYAFANQLVTFGSGACSDMSMIITSRA